MGSNFFRIFDSKDFSKWVTINDTIMGGSSSAECSVSEDGLLLTGLLVEKGGGFISCRSPYLEEPLNLSKYSGLEIIIDGDGRTFKISISCRNYLFRITNLFDRVIPLIYAIGMTCMVLLSFSMFSLCLPIICSIL